MLKFIFLVVSVNSVMLETAFLNLMVISHLIFFLVFYSLILVLIVYEEFKYREKRRE